MLGLHNLINMKVWFKNSWLIAVVLVFFVCCNPDTRKPIQVNQITELAFPNGRWVDLSYEFNDKTIYWPTSESFQLDTVFEGQTDKGFYYSAYKFSMAEHGGTHLDAPVHFAKGKNPVDKISLDKLNGEAIIIDVVAQCEQNRDYRITPEDVQAWEKENGKIPEQSLLFFKTGFGKYWPDKKKYLGTTLTGQSGVDNLHFPGIHPKTASWLIKNRKINAIGLDTPSIDFGQSKLFETHQILFNENIPAFENVANLDLLPAKGAWVIALPLKITGGSGSPLRIVALVP